MTAFPPIQIQNGSLVHPEPIRDGALYYTQGAFYVYLPKWYHLILKFIWRPPSPSQYNLATINLQNHWIAQHGSYLVRQAQHVTGVLLDVRINTGRPVLIREIMRIQFSINTLERAVTIITERPRRRIYSAPSINSSTKSVGILEIDMETCEISEISDGLGDEENSDG